MIKCDRGHVSIDCDDLPQAAAELSCTVHSVLESCKDDAEVKTVLVMIIEAMNECDKVHDVMDLEYHPENDDTNPDPEELS